MNSYVLAQTGMVFHCLGGILDSLHLRLQGYCVCWAFRKGAEEFH